MGIGMISHSPGVWSAILASCLSLAERDHKQKAPMRNGESIQSQIMDGECRKRHHRVLTTVYRQFRMELNTPLDK